MKAHNLAYVQSARQPSARDEATAKDFLVVREEGSRTVTRKVKHYNLKVIMAVGYRVNSKRATAFRQWATRVLRDFVIRAVTQ
ncbi:MAG TPA: virulence RhuM family protein [Candidatus Sutterella merdavium]|nr:virulence RhuM family protein [Candidatus Sutterella merdavium]